MEHKNQKLTKYANAYTEVYEILQYLEKEEYNKIPIEFLKVIEENRNLDYKYNVNQQQDLMEQPILKETKAILLNIFRDYLATPEQRKKIKKWQTEDRIEVEKCKKKKYGEEVLKNKSIKKNMMIEVPKQKLWKRIIEKIKTIFSI